MRRGPSTSPLGVTPVRRRPKKKTCLSPDGTKIAFGGNPKEGLTRGNLEKGVTQRAVTSERKTTGKREAAKREGR